MTDQFRWLILISFLVILTGSCQSLQKEREVPKEPEKTEEKESRAKEEKPETVVTENVFFQAIDRGEANPEEDKTIYYKLYLNKELVSKTSSGLFFQKKTASLRLEPGRYLFYAERWFLDDSPENDIPEYKRSNNVWQMKPVYLDVPDLPGIVRVVFGFDHGKSSFYMEVSGE